LHWIVVSPKRIEKMSPEWIGVHPSPKRIERFGQIQFIGRV
jgi:hypothetical protein